MVNWKKTQQVYSSSWNQVYSPSPNKLAYGRNLTKEQLGGVIFRCETATFNECLTKQIFGLPAAHYSYVKYISPGMPLFLFNYSDRTLHGIFEAASTGRLFIDDRFLRTADDSEVTRFPAQVQTRVQLQCRPLSEDIFKHVIANNYYYYDRFCFELDHGQASQLIALLKPLAIAPANSVPQNTNRATVPRCLPRHDPSLKANTVKMPESELEEHHSTHSSMIPGFNVSDERFPPLGSRSTGKEKATQNVKDVVMKLKKLVVAHENHNLSLENRASDTPHANDIWSEGKHSEEKEANPNSPLEKEENLSSPLEHQYNIAQLVQVIKELSVFKKTEAERTNYMEQKLVDAELDIQLLKDRFTLLESTHDTRLARDTPSLIL